MRLHAIRPLAVAALIALAVPALADDKKMEMPKPPKELSQLSYFLGSWTCTGKAFATDMGPEHASEAHVSFAKALDGFWYLFHYDETKTAANPMPYHAAGFWGYDTGDKLFVQRCHDNMSGYCQTTSKGWVGDVLTFEGPGSMGGQKMGMRDTFTKKSATEVVHAGAFQGPDGKWVNTDEETCTKAAAKKK